MAYVITAANVKPSASASVNPYTGGEAIAVGCPVYRDAALDKWYKSDANNTTPASGGNTSPATVDGIAVSACAGDGCRFAVCQSDNALEVGATTTDVLASGDVIVLGSTAGTLQKSPADSGSATIIVGVANSATQIKLAFVKGGTVS